MILALFIVLRAPVKYFDKLGNFAAYCPAMIRPKNYRLFSLFATICATTMASPWAHAQISSTTVATALKDPMEISIAPNGDLYVIEREGRVLRVSPKTGAMFVIGHIPCTALHTENKDSTWAREDGLLGIALDPQFDKNQRIYIYYSAPKEMCNRLSRFQLKQGQLDLASEKTLLDIPTDRRDRVCHHGGSLSFDKNGLLYLSTGDNTNPFESNGAAPIDDRDGHDHANAMRSAGNTNDLRGKVLRIKPTENGYEIPTGNLFPKGTAKTRPEIYVMGCRNPFRLSVDPKTQTVYWGEVGPDAGNATNRGPAGHDEVNQAKTAGNHGWPFVIADNKPYPIVNFDDNSIGVVTDPQSPKNPSKINTGLGDLPPARSALIWYPYGESKEFPLIGSGGRNAMAGPVFYFDPQRKFNILAQEDDHSLITYEWMRNKAWKVKLDDQENLVKMELMLDGLQHPMDMEMAADGTIYLLEYGSEWYFNHNGRIRELRPSTTSKAPKIAIKTLADQQYEVEIQDAGSTPATIEWFISQNLQDVSIGKGNTVKLSASNATELRAVATNADGQRYIERINLIKETMPSLAIAIDSAPPQIGFGETLKYHVTGAENAKDIVVRARYIPPTGHDAGGPAFAEDAGKLINAKQCLACHQVDATSVGPRYLDVAMRYHNDKTAAAKLKEKLKTGGSGSWGEIPMPPQTAVNEEEAANIITAILALSEGMGEARGADHATLQLPAAPASAAAGGSWEITAEAPNRVAAKTRIPAK